MSDVQPSQPQPAPIPTIKPDESVPTTVPNPTSSKSLMVAHSPYLFLAFATLNMAAIFYLVANNQSVPPEFWATLFGALTAAGVVTVPKL